MLGKVHMLNYYWVLTTAEAVNFIGLFTCRTPEHAARHITTFVFPDCVANDMRVSGFLSLLMSDGDYRCHRTRNLGSCLEWNEGEAVRVRHK